MIYDSETNRFELLSLDGYNGKDGSESGNRQHRHQHGSSRPRFSRSGDFEFVCANCGYINRISSPFVPRNKNQEHRSHSPFSRRESSNLRDFVLSSGESLSDVALRLEEENGKRSYADVEPESLGARKRRKSSDAGTNGQGDQARYITTSSGDLLRGDYFRLLAQIDWPNKESSRGIVQKAISDAEAKESEENEKVGGEENEKIEGEESEKIESVESEKSEENQKSDNIPYQLINQGYFKKFFKVLQTLGHGSNGVVYKVEHELMGLNLGVFALKKIAIGNNVPNLLKILNEVQFLYNLSDKAYRAASESGSGNIVRYNHVWLEIDQLTKFGPKVPVIFILYEYCGGGDLEQFVNSVANPRFDINREKMRRKMRRLSESETRAGEKSAKIFDEAKYSQKNARFLTNYEIFKIFNDAVNGVAYLHRLKIIHRDLKPSNCLFKTSFPPEYRPITSISELNKIPTLLVSDFGESTMENAHRTSTGTTGTLEFCAPELFQLDVHQGKHKLKEFTHSSDVYSLGMILYYLCFNNLPFRSSSPAGIRTEILECRSFDTMDTIRPLCASKNDARDENWLLSDWVDLIRQMTDPNRENRPSAPEIVAAMRLIYQKLAGEDAVLSFMSGEDDHGSINSVKDEKIERDEDGQFNRDSERVANSGSAAGNAAGNGDLEIVALINDRKSGQPEKWHLQFCILLVLTVANLWLWRSWQYLVNAEYLALGLSLNPEVQYYLIVLQVLLFACGMGIAFLGIN